MSTRRADIEDKSLAPAENKTQPATVRRVAVVIAHPPRRDYGYGRSLVPGETVDLDHDDAMGLIAEGGARLAE